MPNRYQVSTPQRVYTVVDDVIRPLWQLLVTGQLLTDALETAVVRAAITTPQPGIRIKIAADGFFALSGNPAWLFPALDSQDYQFDLTIAADYHQSITANIFIPSGTTFPIALPTTYLVYTPIRLQGRLTRDDIDHTPVVGGLVMVDEPDYLTLRTPLHFDHDLNTPVHPCTLTPTGINHTLTADAAQHSHSLTLDDRTGLNPGDILRLGQDHQYDYVIIDTIVGNPADPGEVTLTGPLNRRYAANTTVTQITAVVDAATQNLTQARAAGESLLPLDGPLTADHIQIESLVPNQTEYHTLGALSDSDGYYRLDGIGRFKDITLHASGAGEVDDKTWRIDPQQRINRLDFRLKSP